MTWTISISGHTDPKDEIAKAFVQEALLDFCQRITRISTAAGGTATFPGGGYLSIEQPLAQRSNYPYGPPHPPFDMPAPAEPATPEPEPSTPTQET